MIFKHCHEENIGGWSNMLKRQKNTPMRWHTFDKWIDESKQTEWLLKILNRDTPWKTFWTKQLKLTRDTISILKIFFFEKRINLKRANLKTNFRNFQFYFWPLKEKMKSICMCRPSGGVCTPPRIGPTHLPSCTPFASYF